MMKVSLAKTALFKNVFLRLLLVGSLAAFGIVSQGCDSESPVEPVRPDTTAPAIASVFPEGDSRADSLPNVLIITFSETVDASFPEVSIEPNLPGSAVLLPNEVRYNISTPPEYGITYTVTFRGTIKDKSGNSATIDTSWTFKPLSNDTEAPQIVMISPTGIQNDSLSDSVVVVLSESFIVESARFDIQPGIQGETKLAEKSLSFIPTLEFALGTEYSVRLVLSISDSVGNMLQLDTSWTFMMLKGKIVYVAPGSNGDGAKENPFGTIQQALDADTPGGEEYTINVSIGEYAERPVIETGLTISGGHDPLAGWALTDQSQTIITGGVSGLESVGLIVRDVSDTVFLKRLTIHSPAPVEPSGNSYGIYVENATRLVLEDVVVSSSAGGSGMAGSSGVPGVDGAMSDSARGGAGGEGAYELGGRLICDELGCFWSLGSIVPAVSGEAGFCSDRSQTGGNGGLAGGGDGEAGIRGTDGLDGGTGASILVIDGSDLLAHVSVSSGQAGENGKTYGCGGGGGGGGRTGSFGHASGYPPGGYGGAGGNGGGPGPAGEGGAGAGSSIAIFLKGSSLKMTDANVTTGAGGDGGSGGAGGRGGIGELGGAGDFISGGIGGKGGNGGDGGQGGHGGGGAGGWSVGVLLVNSALLDKTNVTWNIAPAGAGGASLGNPGEIGRQMSIYTLVP